MIESFIFNIYTAEESWKLTVKINAKTFFFFFWSGCYQNLKSLSLNFSLLFVILRSEQFCIISMFLQKTVRKLWKMQIRIRNWSIGNSWKIQGNSYDKFFEAILVLHNFKFCKCNSHTDFGLCFKLSFLILLLNYLKDPRIFRVMLKTI